MILRVTAERGRGGRGLPERAVIRKSTLNPFGSAPAISQSSRFQENLAELVLKIPGCHRLSIVFQDLFVDWVQTEGPIRRWKWVHD